MPKSNAFFRSQVSPLPPLRLLKALVAMRTSQSFADLRATVWDGDPDCSDKNIMTHLSKLRDCLRSAFHLANKTNPIPTKSGVRLEPGRLLPAGKRGEPE